ncbi:MAG: peptidylprolyl isomerase [Acutalibacteraceae bacterium]|nr:peptidylprolyl isomerase [Acutalibacteraceae bacterium]
MKKIISLILCMLFVVSAFAGCGNNKAPEDNTTNPTAEGAAVRHVEMTFKDYGTVKIELYPNEAPITVENFIKLAESGFYDGIGLHRYVEDFVLQGGDPDGDGRGGSKDTIKGEFEINGVQNNIKHKRGVISMARTPVDYDSASSQFFICLNDMTASGLDRQYAAFGMITEGMDIIDKICSETPVSDSIPKDQQPVIETIKVID